MFYNGLVTNEGSVKDMKEAMIWMHEHYEYLPEMGKRSLVQAAPYDSKIWAEKFRYMIEGLE